MSRATAGGASQIVFGDGPAAGGGGTHQSSNRFANGSNQNAGNVLTDRSSTRIHQGPGGHSSICLGSDASDYMPSRRGAAPPPRHEAVPQVPEPADPPYRSEPSCGREPQLSGARAPSSNCWASGANQNCGNFISDRPSTRVHYGPGGASSICLGEEPSSQAPAPRARAPAAVESAPALQAAAAEQQQQVPTATRTPTQAGGRAPSSNHWASGANQNCGNFISDRPSTRIHHGPGGQTSICLGTDDSNVNKAVGRRSNNENENILNTGGHSEVNVKPYSQATRSQIVFG